MKAVATLHNAQQGHQVVSSWWPEMKARLVSGEKLEIEVRSPRRTLDQNARLWASLTEVSRQVDWHGQKLEPGEWKDVLTAALKRQKVVPGIDGGFVVLGSSTSRMTKGELSELLELVYAFGAQHGVTFRDAALPQDSAAKGVDRV